ncbi:serine/threonine-protein phosphatase 7 long form homolog [Cryptomeria japonica]|uniref:serine/threonine-protein phosphatase 7 long form homolog n=1 Tax=Cryptomeria japonica TaxID=3369 RepID=UPI0027DA6FF8|nr:serine/threonine-protein phosphatase 7 long form homolog [Cryptomeria japonica]
MSPYQKNRALLTALAERWYNKHNTFHLPKGEFTVTLKDVYRIIWIPITGDLVVYDVEKIGRTDALREVFGDPYIAGYSVAWQDMVDSYAPLPSVLAGLIGSFLVPDRRSHGLSVSWGQVIYDDVASLAFGCTLLQIWAWEHIAVTRLIGEIFRLAGAPYVMMYIKVTSHPMLEKLEYWRRALDDMDTVVWRLYRLCEPWPEDGFEVPYLFLSRFLLG